MSSLESVNKGICGLYVVYVSGVVIMEQYIITYNYIYTIYYYIMYIQYIIILYIYRYRTWFSTNKHRFFESKSTSNLALCGSARKMISGLV